MPHVLVMHEVEDYRRWRPGYDDHAGVRADYGCLSDQVFRDANDPNKITILLEWDSFEGAEQFLNESGVQDLMAELGVTGPPTVLFLNEV